MGCPGSRRFCETREPRMAGSEIPGLATPARPGASHFWFLEDVLFRYDASVEMFMRHRQPGPILLPSERVQRSSTFFRCEGPPFPHLQLLSPPASAEESITLRSIPGSPGTSAAAISIGRSGVCRDARACASARDGATKINAVDRHAGIETRVRPEFGRDRCSRVSQMRRDPGHPTFFFNSE